MFTSNRTGSASITPKLSPESLFEHQAKIDTIRLEVYNKLLSAVHRKITMVSKLHKSTQMTHYDVPEWTPGYPRYDVKESILFIVWHLRSAGFKVVYIPHNRLLISWESQSEQYYMEESPIRQAMIAVIDDKTKEKPVEPGKPERKKPGSYKPALTDQTKPALTDTGKTKSITFI